MKCQILLDILLLIGIVYIFSMCSNGERNVYNDNKTHANYEINHYLDTINNNIVLTTVCEYKHSGIVSISTLKLNN